MGYVDGASLMQYAKSLVTTLRDTYGLACSSCVADYDNPWDNVPSRRPEKPCSVYTDCKGTLRQRGPVPSTTEGDCGTPTDLVPNNPFGFKFHSCCRVHDACYGTCATLGEPRNECDNVFCDCLGNVCSGLDDPVSRVVCHLLSEVYCNAVRTAGRRFYCAAQERHCECVG
jgi:hypothetical protein